MTIRQLKIFREVYRTGNVTKAAEILYMTQPAVSRTIREIEEEYNVRLFERFNRRLTPTETGKALYARVLQILSGFEEMETELESGSTQSTVRVGATMSLGSFLLPGLISRFAARYPEADIKASVLSEQNLERMLLENELDLALIENEITHPDLTRTPFGEDRLIPVFSNDHPLAEKETITLAELLSCPLLLREKGSAARTFFDSVLASEGLHAEPVWESSSPEALIQAAASGIGVTILPEHIVKEHLAKALVCTRPIAGASMVRTCYIVMHKDKYVSELMRALIDLIKA